MENQNAVLLQSVIRRFLTVRRIQKRLRQEFDDGRNQLKNQKLTLDNLAPLVKRLILAFGLPDDAERLVSSFLERSLNS